MSSVIEIKTINENLYAFEKVILTGGKNDALLPVTVIEKSDRTTMVYITDEYVPLTEFECSDLNEMFGVIQSIIFSYLLIEDSLLDPCKIYNDPELIYVVNHGLRKGNVKFLYGKENGSGKMIANSSASAVTRDAAVQGLLEILVYLAEKGEIMGAISAINGTIEMIGHAKTNLTETRRIVSLMRREWNHIQPS